MKRKTKIAFIWLLILIPFRGQAGWAAPLRAEAIVKQDSVFLGEAFTLQIQVSGSENPARPDLSGLTDFKVEYQGSRQNSSTSVTIINGQVTRNINKGYVFSYQLVPKRVGRLLIPSITVQANGYTAQTAPVYVRVEKPAETDDFKLRLGLSKSDCYVGEPVTLTVTWYLGADVREFRLDLPLLEKKDAFYFIDPEVDTSSGGKFYRIPLADGEVVARKGQKRLDHKTYATISFKKILIPKKSGHFRTKPATVVCEALTGYTRRRPPFNDDFFSDFFNDDFFGGGLQGVYRKVAVPSNSLELQVFELPLKGKPANFAGHVGEYKIEAQADPKDVSVGDPITLKITISGPEYLKYVKLPPLNQQASLKKDFKIPRERAVGEISGKVKVFTQTIRPLRPGIKEIPPIELSYFDTRAGEYRVAQSDPIPITVKAARVVTARDAEGSVESGLPGNQVETWTKGIAYNYDDPSVIENQRFGPAEWFKSPVVLGMTGMPPLIYFLLLGGNLILTRLYSDPTAVRSRKAFGRLKAALKRGSAAQSNQQACDIILAGLRNYLGDKLGIPTGALTFKDVKKPLIGKGVTADTLAGLNKVFECCEAGRYAGDTGLSEISVLTKQVLKIARELEKKLK